MLSFALVGLALLGVGAVLVWPSTTPELQITGFTAGVAEGDILEVQCASCPDGAEISAGAKAVPIVDGRALVPAPRTLALGDNDISLELVEPNHDRSEVSLVLPVPFRVQTELDGLGDERPSLTIAVQAPPGANVSIDGNPVEVSKDGRAAYSLDLSKATRGEAASVEVLKDSTRIEVAEPDGPTHASTVPYEVAVTPLVLLAPGPEMTLRGQRVPITGRTAPGAEVHVGPQTTRANETGRFNIELTDAKTGDIQIRAAGARQATRAVGLRLLDPGETVSGKPVGYEKLVAGLTERVSFEGRVAESRDADEGTTLLLEVDEQCPETPCLVSVLYAGKPALERGDRVQVIGHAQSITEGAPPRVRAIDLRSTSSSP